MAFAEFKVAVIGPDGRPGKATRLRADTDDPARGDVILLAGAWHEVVDIAHVPDEHKRPRTVGTIVFVKPLRAPPAWLRELQGRPDGVPAAGDAGDDGGTGGGGTGAATRDGWRRGPSKLIQLTVIDGGGAAPSSVAETVRQEPSFSQMATLARSVPAANVPHHIDDQTLAARRRTPETAATVEHALPSPRPTPASPVPAPDVHNSRSWRPSRGLTLVLPLVLVAALVAAFAASYFLS